ncbi:MAG: hypothetical protein NZ750_02335 [Anaerolineae bacterium]|nr:hypothetical protein [Anaerolineae bacterium]MDW8173482.1 hypothetical protein [Anaerolineae bacterium]
MRARWLSLLLLAACSAPPAPTALPTRQLSAPTLAPSPVIPILSSEQLYSATLSAGRNNPTAAALPNNAPLPPWASAANAEGVQTVAVTLSAVLSVQGDLYAPPGQRLPGVVLLTSERTAWGALPLALQGAGLAVLAVDWPAAGRPEDVGRLLESFSELVAVDPGRLAVLAAGQASGAALRGCALEALCDGLALLSPSQADADALSQVVPRPVLVVASQDDATSYAAALALAALPGVQSIQAPSGRGANMLASSPPLIEALVAWLSSVLRSAP